MIRFGIVEREPQMREHGGTVHVEDRERCAGLDGAEIGIAAGGVGTGNPL